MKTTLIKLFFLVLFGLFSVSGCARQTGAPASASIDALAGSYRVLQTAAEPDYTFTLKQKNGAWRMTDAEGSLPVQKMTPAEIEDVLSKEAANKAQCLEGFNETTRFVICLTEVGFTTNVRVDGPAPYSREFTSKTGYFLYADSIDAWDLEKLK